MPSLKVHCVISKRRTGQSFKDLHAWIDAPRESLGVNHRNVRHSYNLDDEKIVRTMWGEKGVIEWLFHIALDNLETAFKKSKTFYKDKAFNYFEIGFSKDSSFIHNNSDILTDEELEILMAEAS